MSTGEFEHYKGCGGRDPYNCAACALTTPTMISHGPNDERMGINYAAWPLSYIQNGRRIPERFMGYLVEELNSDNLAYVENLKRHLEGAGYDLNALVAKAKGGAE